MAKNKLTETIDELISETVTEEASAPKGPFRATVINPNSDGNEHLRTDNEETETIVRTPGTKKFGVTDWRDIKIAGKNYKLQRRDPYGFWYVVPARGPLPKELDQMFTSPLEAQKAIEVYINKSS